MSHKSHDTKKINAEKKRIRALIEDLNPEVLNTWNVGANSTRIVFVDKNDKTIKLGPEELPAILEPFLEVSTINVGKGMKEHPFQTFVRTEEEFEEDEEDEVEEVRKKVTELTVEGSVIHSNQLEAWPKRKIIKYMLSESDNFESILACLVDSLKERGDSDKAYKLSRILESIPQDSDLLDQARTTRKKSPLKSPLKSPRKSPKKDVIQMDEDEGDYTEEEDENPMGELQELIDYYNAILDKDDPDEKALARMKKSIRIQAKALGMDPKTKEGKQALRDIGFMGFGRSSPQSYRGRKSRRKFSRVGKKKARRTTKRMRSYGKKTRKFSKAKKTTYRAKHRMGRLRSKPTAAGSSGDIYGLQDGPHWEGVFPMTLDVKEAGANILNVQRDYRLFGGAKRLRSGRKGRRRMSGRKQKARRKKLTSNAGAKLRKRRSYGVFKPPSPLTIV